MKQVVVFPGRGMGTRSIKQVQKMTIHKAYRTEPSLIFLMYYWAAILLINQIINEINKLYTKGTRRLSVIIFSEPGRAGCGNTGATRPGSDFIRPGPDYLRGILFLTLNTPRLLITRKFAITMLFRSGNNFRQSFPIRIA
ncbi:MAG: hypothetical protein ABSE63_15785 [Thermoguttaceae bacterium]|jgi:hypothetical protein